MARIAYQSRLDTLEASLQEQGDVVLRSVRGAMDALERADVELCDEVIRFDDEIDTRYHRIEKTVEYVKRMMLWLGVMTLLLLMAVFQLVVDANSNIPPQLDSTRLYVIVAAFVLFMVLWALAFWRKFARLPAASGDNPFG